MANIKSAKKRIEVAERNNARNKSVKSDVKTSVKKVYAAIDSADKTAMAETFNEAESKLMKASKGVINKKAASRKVSRLAKAINKAQ